MDLGFYIGWVNDTGAVVQWYGLGGMLRRFFASGVFRALIPSVRSVNLDVDFVEGYRSTLLPTGLV